MRRLFVLTFLIGGLACGHPKIVGSATVHGDLANMPLASTNAQSILRTKTTNGDPSNGELMIADGDLACDFVARSNHLTIDLGGIGVGTYTVVAGYPTMSRLGRWEARVHACPPQRSGGACDEKVLGGQVVVTSYATDASGEAEGTFDLKFADGELTGTFTAPRCN